LIELLLLCEGLDGSFEMLRPDLVIMERYAVRGRYPGQIAEREDARATYAAAKTTRDFVRQNLGIK
jgi:hypothetical protein